MQFSSNDGLRDNGVGNSGNFSKGVDVSHQKKSNSTSLQKSASISRSRRKNQTGSSKILDKVKPRNISMMSIKDYMKSFIGLKDSIANKNFSTCEKVRKNFRDLTKDVGGFTDEFEVDLHMINNLSLSHNIFRELKEMFLPRSLATDGRMIKKRKLEELEAERRLDDEILDRLENELESLSKKAKKRTPIDIINTVGDMCNELYEKLNAEIEEYSKFDVAKIISEELTAWKVPNLCDISPQKIKYWSEFHEKTRKNEGRERFLKEREEFDRTLLSKLMLAIEEIEDDVKRYKIIQNITYSYEMIRIAGAEVLKVDKWKNHPHFGKLTFSNYWCRRLFLRIGFTRRKSSREKKNIPSIDRINEVMKKHRLLYISNNHSAESAVNFDETAYTYAIGEKFLFAPKDSVRGEVDDNQKLRITAGLSVNGLGDFLRLFIIIKHSVKNPTDESSIMVLKSLRKQLGPDDETNEWDFAYWEKDINGVHYKCGYLRHKILHHIIVSQTKAWMNEIKFSMLIDLVFYPYLQNLRTNDPTKHLMLWMDNCRSHTTPFLKEQMNNLDIDTCFFPENTTAMLQPLDLVVNGPIKKHTRHNKAKRIFAQFQTYMGNIINNDGANDNIETFTPSKPKLKDAIIDLIDLLTSYKDNEQMKKNIVDSFRKTNILPETDQNKLYKEFSVLPESSGGTLSYSPLYKNGNSEETFKARQFGSQRNISLDLFAESDEIEDDDSDYEGSDSEEDSDADDDNF